MGEIAAAQMTARGHIDTRDVDAREIIFAAATAAFGNACSDAFNDRMKTHDVRGLMGMRGCMALALVLLVIPAKAGTNASDLHVILMLALLFPTLWAWVPAFAGMTK
jgi:hypothetical protein